MLVHQRVIIIVIVIVMNIVILILNYHELSLVVIASNHVLYVIYVLSYMGAS